MSNRKPGWSLDRPFDLTEAARDIIAAAQILAAHGRHPTGTSEQAAEVQQATTAIHAVSRRVDRHSPRRD
ncbi:hypothetical protein [Kitasatospora sp. NPDC058478]|uniref:hypothetical protein n=1 Tax=unclassified Kitasatospora TaxID=2633591 RepID=UPI0036580CAE